MTRALIVGDVADSHVRAVIAAVRNQGGEVPFLVDAPTLAHRAFCLSGSQLTVAGDAINLGESGPGWLRRYAPSAWGVGLVAGSLDAARTRAFLSLVGSISRVGAQQWLTGLESLLRAEDRLLQLASVSRLGYRTPRTLVTSDGDTALAHLGAGFVVKPLANGYFETSTGPRAVFTSSMTMADLAETDFSDAPFVAQERIDVGKHLRVVTVRDQAWVASLDAMDRPLDWRRQEEAHSSWSATRDAEVTVNALAVASALGVGFSSQDWVRDNDGPVFLDLNPGGQWLFLPDDVAVPVTRAIARFLMGDET